MANLEYRHPIPDDIEDIVNLINTSNKDDPLWDIQNVQAYRRNSFEDDDWEAEGHWLVLHDGTPVGFGGSIVLKRHLEHGRNEGWMALWVLQDYREEGIQQELVRRAVEYLGGRGVAQAKIWDLIGTEWRISVLEKFGFKETWHEYIMIKKTPDIPSPEHPEGLEFEDFFLKDSTDQQLTDYMNALNRAFSQDEMFVPRTMESLKKWKEASADISRINLAKIDGNIVGECLSFIEVGYNKEHNVNTGWIGAFGVLKDYRRKGVGKALLVIGMKWLQDRGMDTLYLCVAVRNPKALNLYKSVGFEIEQEGITYCLEL
jgi:GNAT superfamily N-acetyltransferase